jgi:hypothetical protein
MPPEEIATVITAIGNHDEETAFPVNPVAAALILADKTDVRESRVRKGHEMDPDIHDRVNFSVKRSAVSVDTEEVLLDLTIDTDFCPVMDYFEIFLGRMNLCREAAAVLGVRFSLVINGQRMV